MWSPGLVLRYIIPPPLFPPTLQSAWAPLSVRDIAPVYIWGCARNGGGVGMEKVKKRESGGMMKEGRDKAGNLSGRFSPGQENATQHTHTYIYIYT